MTASWSWIRGARSQDGAPKELSAVRAGSSTALGKFDRLGEGVSAASRGEKLHGEQRTPAMGSFKEGDPGWASKGEEL